MKSVTTKIGDKAVIISVESVLDDVVNTCSFELPYSLVHPRVAVQIAGMIASDPCVTPVGDGKN